MVALGRLAEVVVYVATAGSYQLDSEQIVVVGENVLVWEKVWALDEFPSNLSVSPDLHNSDCLLLVLLPNTTTL